MARIDRLLQAAAQAGSDCLVLKAGERVFLVIGNEKRAVTPQPITGRQVGELLAEIIPPEMSDAVDMDGDHEFDYRSPAGPVVVRVSRSGESLTLSARFGGGNGGATAGGAAGGRGMAVAAGATVRARVPPPRAEGAPRSSATPRRDGGSMDRLLVRMVEAGCSDLHLTSGNPPLFRKHGDIVSLGEDPALSPDEARDLLYSITPEDRRAEFEESHDVDFSHEIADVARFRCNLFRDRRGMGGVFRVIPTKIPSAQDLGLPRAVLELCDLPKGLVVVTGPTGSGKSTTLASMIDHINGTEAAHIITIEDPIEFVHPTKKSLVNQREVGNHTRGFKAALRAALREDPDIVLVGEMRDLETVSIAIETAETGHLVFGTLHTNTAPSTVDRIIDQFPADRQNQVRTMLSESLKGVIAQTLCKKKGGGRVAAMEILIVNSAVANLIREGKTFQIPSVMQTGRGVGMVTLGDSLFDLVKRGLVEPEEALANAIHKAEFKSLLERNNIRLAA